MTMSVMERIGEIGTSMALGVKRTGIMRLFVSEGILIGCLGGLLGLMLGLIIGLCDLQHRHPMPPPPGMARGYTGQILVTWDIALESLALAVGTTLARQPLPCLESITDADRRRLAS